MGSKTDTCTCANQSDTSSVYVMGVALTFSTSLYPFKEDPLSSGSRTIFLLYIEKKIGSATGRGRFKGGFSTPERRKSTGVSSAEGRGRSTSGSCRYMKCDVVNSKIT